MELKSIDIKIQIILTIFRENTKNQVYKMQTNVLSTVLFLLLPRENCIFNHRTKGYLSREDQRTWHFVNRCGICHLKPRTNDKQVYTNIVND